MKVIARVILGFIFLSLAVSETFAHETEVVHEEAIPTISPIMLVGIVAVLAIGGFLLWKFVLSSPKSSLPTIEPLTEKMPAAQEKTVSQSGESEVSSQDK